MLHVVLARELIVISQTVQRLLITLTGKKFHHFNNPTNNTVTVSFLK